MRLNCIRIAYITSLSVSDKTVNIRITNDNPLKLTEYHRQAIIRIIFVVGAPHVFFVL